MNQNRFWDLLAKRQSGEATPEEQTELSEHIINYNIDKNLLNKVNAFWDMPVQQVNAPSEQAINFKWNQLQQKINAENNEIVEITQHRSFFSRWKIQLSIAASILIVFFSYIWLLNKNNKNNNPLNENIVSTKNGSKSKVQLPDGTTVWLNAGSKILYDEAYNKEERNVQLIGEAFFDVAHNADKPFIIHTKAMNVKVLGTMFNVRAYPTDKFTEAALIKGSIEVTFPGSKRKKVILKPNEKITVSNLVSNYRNDDEKLRKAEEDDAEMPDNTDVQRVAVSHLTYQPADSLVEETAWVMQNKLVFRSKSFAELSADMERWFNVNIRFADADIMDVKFTGIFSTETITEALNALQLSYHFKFKTDKNNNIITIYNK